MYPALTDLDVNADKHIAPYVYSCLLCVIIICHIEIEYNITFIIFILIRLRNGGEYRRNDIKQTKRFIVRSF